MEEAPGRLYMMHVKEDNTTLSYGTHPTVRPWVQM